MPRVWQFEHRAGVPSQKSEIVAYDDRTDTLYVAGVVGIRTGPDTAYRCA